MVRRRGKSQSMLPDAQLASGGAPPPPFVVNPVDFDAITDRLNRASDFSGNADSKVGICSVWFRLDGGVGSQLELVNNSGTRFIIRKNPSDKMRVNLENSAGTDILEMPTVTTFGVSATWFNLLASWDLSVPTADMYINDAQDRTFGVGPIDDTIDWTRSSWQIGSSPGGTRLWNGCLAEIYLNTAEFLDFSVVANRRKFITAGISPVDLGSDGSTPTGTAPIMYLRNPAATFEVNEGTGGDFVVTGTLTACSSSP